MNPAPFLAYFDRIVDFPEAVPFLRRFILDLAVRGRLVEQDPKDEHASYMLCKRQVFPKADRQPWKLPPGWAWSSYATVGETIGGGTPSKGNPEYWNGSIPWVSPKDMKVDHLNDSQDHVSELAVKQSSTRLIPAGSLLMVVRGMILAHSFPTAMNLVPVTINQDMKGIIPFRFDFGDFLLLVSKGMKPEVMRLVLRSTHGTCKLLTNDLFSMPIPIPPLAEQRRILVMVDELMALCDRFETAQVERERRRNRLAAASFRRLNQPTGADVNVFREHARFHLLHFPHFTTRPNQIPQLRQTILNLAVRGRLVTQDPNEEAAPSLGIPVAANRGDRLDLALPNNWTWTKVEDVAKAKLGKMLDKAKNTGKSYRYLRNTNVHWFEIRMDDLKELQIEPSEVAKFSLKIGDVLICEGGHGIGRSAVWRNHENDVLYQKALHRVRPGPRLSSEFFAYCIFVYFHAGILQNYYTGVGIPHFTGKALSELVFPLPPIAEQLRIVARVGELMALCDRLETQLVSTQTESRRFLEAVLDKALAPTK